MVGGVPPLVPEILG